MMWSGDGSFFGDILGTLDFAGGTVVHVNAGVAALVCALVVGKRQGYGVEPMPPHNLAMTVMGTGMLWVGWFGFNAGSAVAANGTAGMAMLVTQVASATAALTWMAIEWFKYGRPSVLGAATGAVAGLATVTQGSGYMGPFGAFVTGIAAGIACFLGATTLKKTFRYDDSLDAFGVHGVGGAVGALLTGVFASSVFGGSKIGLHIGHQVLMQFTAMAITAVYSGVATLLILKAIDARVGLRVTPDEEFTGLDLADHGETGYNP
jgi:Amt family ammonium transporter